jgi:hypothetical protein
MDIPIDAREPITIATLGQNSWTTEQAAEAGGTRRGRTRGEGGMVKVSQDFPEHDHDDYATLRDSHLEGQRGHSVEPVGMGRVDRGRVAF